MVGVEQGGWHTHDVWDHTANAVALTPADILTRLAALFHDVGKPETHVVAADGKHTFYDHPTVGAATAERVMQRLRFSNDEIAAVADLVRLHLRPIQYERDTHSDSAVRRLVRDVGPLRSQLLDLARADTRASAYPNVDNIDDLERRMAELDKGGKVTRLRPPLDGNRLQQIAGRPAGPWIGEIHRALIDAILDGRLPADDSAAAEAWLSGHPELTADA